MKMTILPKTTCRFNANSIKTPTTLFTEIKKNYKIHMEPEKKIQKITETVLNRRMNTGEITLPDFRIHHRAIVIKTAIKTGMKTDI